jgi:hypothetical protein
VDNRTANESARVRELEVELEHERKLGEERVRGVAAALRSLADEAETIERSLYGAMMGIEEYRPADAIVRARTLLDSLLASPTGDSE